VAVGGIRPGAMVALTDLSKEEQKK
jgi:hypothetical protein